MSTLGARPNPTSGLSDISFTLPVASTVVHSRDEELLKAMTGSQAFLNGIAGEQWSRLIGGHFA